MEGAITSIESLRKKFYDDGYPHWNLYGSDGKAMFAQNRKGGKVEMDESWKRLQDNIDSLNNPDGRLFKLQTFPNEGSNHGLTVWLQIYRTPGAAPAHQVASIGSLGVGGVEDIINTKIAIARLEMENDALQAQLEAQTEPSVWEKIFTPATVQGLIGALLRQPAQVQSAPINGVPEPETHVQHPPQPTHQDTDPDDQDEEIFKKDTTADLLCDTADTLGVDPDQLVEKLAALVQQNPEMAKSLIG